MHKVLRPIVIGLAAFLCLGPSLDAQGKGKGKGHDKQEPAAAAPRFSTHEAEIITAYYGGSTGNLPPGLAKRGGDLPPGLEKQLRRNGQLPPGLQKKIQPLPLELERRLAPAPPGCRRVVAGTTALLIRDAGNLILDVIQLASGR